MLWANLPDSFIATSIFGRHTLVPIVQPTAAPMLSEPEGSILQRGTDIRFLRRLAWRNGFDCYVQPEPLTGVDQAFFRPRQTLGAPQAVLNVAMGDETNVTGFRIRYDMTQPTSVVAANLDTTTKAPQPALAPVSIQPPMGVEPTLTRVLPPPVVRPVDTGLVRTSDLQTLAQAIADLHVNKWVLMLLINVFLLVCGFFIPPAAIILMTAPILYPIITTAGFDPVWFGVIITINMEIGLIHPPVGLNIYIVNSIAPDVPVTTVMWGTIPYVLCMMLAIVILCIFPEIATGLPDYLMGPATHK